MHMYQGDFIPKEIDLSQMSDCSSHLLFSSNLAVCLCRSFICSESVESFLF